MPKPPLPQPIIDLLVRPNKAVLGTVRPDGQPVTVATWYLYENGQILVNMDSTRKRLAYLRADPRVSLTALDEHDWYTQVSVQGRVVAFVDDPDLTDVDRLAQHYNGQPYPDRHGTRISAWIDVERWHAWGRLRDVR